MKKIFVFLVFCTVPSSLVFGDSESAQILEKLNSLEKTVSDLSFRIFALEKRIISFEEKFLFKEKSSINHSGDLKQQNKTIPDDFEHSEDNFSFINVTYKDSYNDTIFKGEVVNKSNNNYRYALFKISVFNNKGAVVSSNDFYILNLDEGTQRSFEVKLHGIKSDKFVDYAIEFNKGS